MDPIGSYHENSKPSSQKPSPLHNAPHNSNSNVDQDSCPSDCESGICGPENDQARFHSPENGFIRVHKGEMIHETITKKLVSSLSTAHGLNIGVKSIHRNQFSGIMGRVRVESFGLYSRAMEVKCNGNPNVKYAWFGAPKNEIDLIIGHGFGLPTSGRTHGQGVYLYSVNHPIESVQSALPDEEGLRHMLLCRVILGKTELILPGSDQNNPSSEEFDSGVDNVVAPRKYIVWTPRMNTHILPEFLVSFRASPSWRRGSRMRQGMNWKSRMPFPTLINVLSKYLACDAVELVMKHHNDFRKQEITRTQLIQRVRHIAGDKLLMTIMKSYERKVRVASPSPKQDFKYAFLD